MNYQKKWKKWFNQPEHYENPQNDFISCAENINKICRRFAQQGKELVEKKQEIISLREAIAQRGRLIEPMALCSSDCAPQ